MKVMSIHKKTFDYLVIGAGSGGLLVAVGLLGLGKDVVVVSENIGGDCTHFGCIPSKSFLNLAKTYHTECDLEKNKKIKETALNKVQEIVSSFAAEENHLIPESRYFQGKASFINDNSVQIDDQSKTIISFRKKCIIATGSRPVRVTIDGVTPNKVITNEELFYLKKLPRSITVLGGGPIGAEMATACTLFGVETHLVSRSFLPKEPGKISQLGLQQLQEHGVLYYSARPEKLRNKQLFLDDGTTIPETDLYLSAVGRIPNIEIGLDKAGVSYDKTGIQVSKNLVTTNRNIFAIGDCTQNPQFTHLAANHGKFVLKKVMIPFAQRKDRALPRVTFTFPLVASVGELEESQQVKIFPLNFFQTDRALTNQDKLSYGEVAIDTSSGLIVGVSLFGSFSEDLINVFTLLIDGRTPLLSLSDFITPYPTYSNIFHNLVLDYLSYLRTNWKKSLLPTIKQLMPYLLT